VKPSRGELEWRSWRHADESPLRVELVEQSEEVEFVGPPSVEEHERPIRARTLLACACGRTDPMRQQLDVTAHGCQDVILGTSGRNGHQPES
jgi:hypothetical protein